MAGIRTITASAVTLTENDRCVEADCTNNAITITLQDLTTAADSDPIPRTITKIDYSANAVTVTAGSGETINGSSSIYLRKQYETVLLIKGELEWVVAARWDGTSTDEGVAAITATATLTPSQTAVFASGASGAVTITLADPAATKGVPIRIIVTNATNPITVADNGSETISGESTIVLSRAYDFLEVVSNGTMYYVTSSGNLLSYYSRKGTAGTGVVAAEYGDGYRMTTVLTVTLTGANDIDFADGADATIAALLYTFPQCFLAVEGVVCNLSSTTNAGMLDPYELALGSAAGTSADVDISGTDEDFMAGIAVTNGSAQAAQGYQLGALLLDGHTTASKLYLNVAQADAGIDVGGGTVALTGTITITWTYMGDY